MFVQPHDILNLEQDLNPGTSRVRSVNVILLLLLTLQPYTEFFPLHQVIPCFYILEDVAQIPQFYLLEIIYHFASPSILWSSFCSYS